MLLYNLAVKSFIIVLGLVIRSNPMNGVFEKKELTIIALKASDIWPYPLMFHKHIELMYVLEGSLSICIDSKSTNLEKGDLSVTFPYVIHSNQKADATVAILLFDPGFCGNFTNLFAKRKPSHPYIRKDDLPDEIPYLIEKIIANNNSDEFALETVKGYLTALIGELLKVIKLEMIEDNDINTTQQILMYCLENYSEDLSLDRISDDLHVSKTHITHVFSTKLNCNFREYINNMRINDVKYLLEKTDMSILDIMLECGFNSQSTFNRTFIKTCGITPFEYREETQKKQ